jgi:GNAT superfamily N-acetyltransferase
MWTNVLKKEVFRMSGWMPYNEIATDLNQTGGFAGGLKAVAGKMQLALSEKNEPVGHLIIAEINNGHTWLHEVLVDEEHRGKGIANTLMDSLIEDYGNDTIAGVIIPSGDMGETALGSFYRKYGFETSTVPLTDGSIGTQILREA